MNEVLESTSGLRAGRGTGAIWCYCADIFKCVCTAVGLMRLKPNEVDVSRPVKSMQQRLMLLPYIVLTYMPFGWVSYSIVQTAWSTDQYGNIDLCCTCLGRARSVTWSC